MKKDRTIIIGASGFLGKHVCKKYVSEENIFTFNKNYIEGGIKFDAINMDFEETVGDLSRFKKGSKIKRK